MFYGFESTDATYSQGTQTASLESTARSSGTSLNTALDGVEPGSMHGASVIKDGITAFKEDAKSSVDTLANGVESLGNGTSNVAVTGDQTQNETTALYNTSGALNRRVNDQLDGVMAV